MSRWRDRGSLSRLYTSPSFAVASSAMKALVLEEKHKLSLRDFSRMNRSDPRCSHRTSCGGSLRERRALLSARAPSALRGSRADDPWSRGGRRRGRDRVKRCQFEGGRPRLHGAGIPDPNSQATRLGNYNLDPSVRFWATPPVHGVLRPTVVHPAAFTFKLPDNVRLQRAQWWSRSR